MADILIRGGMKFPTCCEACYLFFEKRVGFASLEYITNCKLGAKLPTPWPLRFEKRADNCPLVELPPHGDLIDRRELNDSFEPSDFGEDPNNNVYSAIHVVNSMPVIVPSNKEVAD